MGKKRIVILGETAEPKKEDTAAKAKGRAVVRTGKEHGRITDVGAEALAEAAIVEEKAKKLEKELALAAEKKPREKAKVSQKKKGKSRGRAYRAALAKIDRQKFYPVAESVKLIKQISISRFTGSIDAHLTLKQSGLKGEVIFPHPTGKKQIIRIADENLIKELEEGKINFSALVATPAIMPKLLKFAKLLGPRGLMPNPKAGTITDKPEELAKKLASAVQWRTETKSPIVHLTIGRADFPEKHLEENFAALIRAVGQENIVKAVLAPTMGPGVKIDLSAKT